MKVYKDLNKVHKLVGCIVTHDMYVTQILNYIMSHIFWRKLYFLANRFHACFVNEDASCMSASFSQVSCNHIGKHHLVQHAWEDACCKFR